MDKFITQILEEEQEVFESQPEPEIEIVPEAEPEPEVEITPEPRVRKNKPNLIERKW